MMNMNEHQFAHFHDSTEAYKHRRSVAPMTETAFVESEELLRYASLVLSGQLSTL